MKQLLSLSNNYCISLKRIIKFRLLLLTARIRMRVGIKAVTLIHRNSAKNYLDVNSKRLINYIVLLEMPEKKDGKAVFKERLFWVNRFNFKRIKRKGWLPPHMQMDELRKKSFYTSDLKRSYAEEFASREKAITKYISYLKTTQP